jgi:hypothetical protein
MISIMKNIIKVGDTINYATFFGGGPVKSAKVETLTLTEHPREKYGQEVLAADIESVKSNRVVFGLDDGHWCYGSQVKTEGLG